MHSKYTWSRNRFFKINQLHQFLPHKTQILLFLAILMSTTYTDKEQSLLSLKKDIPNSVLCPILFFMELRQTVFPTTSVQAGDHADFVQEEPQGPQCLTKILVTFVVEDVSGCLDILILEFSTILECLSILECRLILRRLLVLRHLVALQ